MDAMYFSIGMPSFDMNALEMQSALHTLLVAIGELGEEESVRGIDLPGIANDYVRRVRPDLMLEDDDA